MKLEVALHPDEVPVAEWLATRMNVPPPGADWGGGAVIVPPNGLRFERSERQVMLDLLDLYADTSSDDHDLNPEAINAAMRLREKILLAS